MGLRTEHIVTELDKLVRWEGGDPICPICAGPIELTPTHAIVCTEHGSEHYRWEMPILIACAEDL